MLLVVMNGVVSGSRVAEVSSLVPSEDDQVIVSMVEPATASVTVSDAALIVKPVMAAVLKQSFAGAELESVPFVGSTQMTS